MREAIYIMAHNTFLQPDFKHKHISISPLQIAVYSLFKLSSNQEVCVFLLVYYGDDDNRNLQHNACCLKFKCEHFEITFHFPGVVGQNYNKKKVCLAPQPITTLWSSVIH